MQINADQRYICSIPSFRQFLIEEGEREDAVSPVSAEQKDSRFPRVPGTPGCRYPAMPTALQTVIFDVRPAQTS